MPGTFCLARSLQDHQNGTRVGHGEFLGEDPSTHTHTEKDSEKNWSYWFRLLTLRHVMFARIICSLNVQVFLN